MPGESKNTIWPFGVVWIPRICLLVVWGLSETIEYIKENAPEQDPIEKIETNVEVVAEVSSELETAKTEGYSSDVEFDDLGNKTE